MTENNNPPVDPVAPTTPVPKKKFSGGIIPGSLHGGRYTGSQPKEEEPNILKEVGQMTSAEYRRWKRDPKNAKKLNEALIARKSK